MRRPAIERGFRPWTFLAVCDSHADLGLRFSDMGHLWAVIPTAELAAGEFTHLLCDGESS